MTTELDLFHDYRYRVKTERPAKTPADVCQSRHGGNLHSVAANSRVRHVIDEQTVYELIEQSEKGLTLHELCAAMGKTPNQISGRVTALKGKYNHYKMQMVEVNGTREGCGINFACNRHKNNPA